MRKVLKCALVVALTGVALGGAGTQRKAQFTRRTPIVEAVEKTKKGIVILKVNDMDTPTVEAFRAATSNIKSGDQVRILFQYRTLKKFVVVSVD